MWKLYALLLLLTAGIAILVCGIIAMKPQEVRQQSYAVQEITGGAVIILMTLAALRALPQKRMDKFTRSCYFEICGDPDTLHERLKYGAEHIRTETDTLVLTEDYLIRRGDPSTYMPYTALTAYYFGYGGGKSADLAVFAKGRTVIIPIRKQNHSQTEQMRQIIAQYAPQAEYGMPMPDTTYIRKRSHP